jgi:hypothetical protein
MALDALDTLDTFVREVNHPHHWKHTGGVPRVADSYRKFLEILSSVNSLVGQFTAMGEVNRGLPRGMVIPNSASGSALFPCPEDRA